MKLLSWNCQGLVNPWIVHSLRKLVKDQDPKVCFLMETCLDKEGYDKHCKEMPFQDKLIVKRLNSGGGLALIWRREVNLDVINYTDNHISAKVVEEDGFVWYLTCFYGWLDASQKQKSWALLNHLFTFVQGPWMCIGDFNPILHSFEKQSSHPPPYKQMDDFWEALDLCNLVDIGFKGYPFMWNNKRSSIANIKEQLDWAVANLEWRVKFLASTLTHLFSHAFDHRTLLLQTSDEGCLQNRGVPSFKFEEKWLLWEECEKIVTEAWSKEWRAPTLLANTKEKIGHCGAELLA